MSAVVANTPDAWTERAHALAAPWEACLWSERGQTVRFRKALELLDPQAGESLLDFGCGTGRLADFLDGSVRYLGFDWSRGMIERAQREHYPLHRRFTKVEPTEPFDLVACIGPFNLPDGWDKSCTRGTLGRLWAQTRRALVVSVYGGTDAACIRYRADELADWAEHLSGSFVVERGYLPNDLMLLLRRT